MPIGVIVKSVFAHTPNYRLHVVNLNKGDMLNITEAENKPAVTDILLSMRTVNSFSWSLICGRCVLGFVTIFGKRMTCKCILLQLEKNIIRHKGFKLWNNLSV